MNDTRCVNTIIIVTDTDGILNVCKMNKTN